jgi:phage terminase large subunit
MKITTTGQKIIDAVYKKKPGECMIIVVEGGSGASKTYSILQVIVMICLQHRGKRVTMLREKSVWFTRFTLKDFLKILTDEGIYSENLHNKTKQEYHLNGNEIIYGGLDNQALHGGRQDIAFINEAIDDGITFEIFYNFLRYTNSFIFLDYNPRKMHSWIYSEVIPMVNCVHILATLNDNEALPEPQRAGILSVKDSVLRKIYVEGLRAQPEGLIFPTFTMVDEYPPYPKREIMGMDFGFENDPSTLYRMCFNEGKLWIDELLYEKGLVTVPSPEYPERNSISERMNQLGIGRFQTIVADCHEMGAVHALQSAGWNVVASDPRDKIKIGIDAVKRYDICITQNSVNLLKERENYSWRRKRGTEYLGLNDFVNEPMRGWDHGWDAVRYGVQYQESRKSQPVYYPKLIKLRA